MKRLILGLLTIGGLFAGTSKVAAQTFTTAHDTVYLTYSGTFGMDVHNDITVPGPGNVSIKWKVVSENFTTDPTWVASSNSVSICNNYSCLTNVNGEILDGTIEETGTYKAAVDGTDSTDVFKATVSLSGANPGTHYFTVNLKDNNSTYNKNVTFIISKWTTSVTNVNKANEEISLYPNPASDDLNVLFDANRDIKNIAVYNVIGKTMSVYRVNGNSAKMDVSKLPNGVYFIRLSDSRGHVVATKRFTKQ